MFSIGISEPIESDYGAFVRHSIVWLGAPCGESARGIPAAHPLCELLYRMLAQSNFLGAWLTCRKAQPMREFERKTLLLRLSKSGWTIAPEQAETIRAHKAVTADSPWPFGSASGLPWPQSDILVVGLEANYENISCQNEGSWPSGWASRSEALVLNSDLARVLASSQGYSVSIRRTQTDNSPGLSVLGLEGRFDPESVVEPSRVVGVHRGADAARAWSYARM